MAYTMDARVRYSETGTDRKITLKAILDYFQDIAVFHSEDIGATMEKLDEKHLVWFLSSWQICINEYPAVNTRIKVSTWPYNFKGIIGERNFLLQTEDEKILAYANSLWVIMDTDKQKPALFPKNLAALYTLEDRYDMDYAPRKIPVPEGGEWKEPLIIIKEHLDSNHHVNNGNYVKIAMEYLPDDFEVRELRAEYKKPALLGDRVYPYVDRVDNEWFVVLADVDKEPYAIVAFK